MGTVRNELALCLHSTDSLHGCDLAPDTPQFRQLRTQETCNGDPCGSLQKDQRPHGEKAVIKWLKFHKHFHLPSIKHYELVASAVPTLSSSLSPPLQGRKTTQFLLWTTRLVPT